MILREGTIEDLPELARIGSQPYAESNLPGRLIPEVFCKNWKKYIETGIGKVFVVENSSDIVGAIGLLVYPDPNDDVLSATDAFWYAVEGSRAEAGLMLFRYLEKWARQTGIGRIVMAHCSMTPKRFKRFYKHKGYKYMQTHYFKEM